MSSVDALNESSLLISVPSATRSAIAAWDGRERRATDKVSRLSRQFDSLCTGAVAPAEIAAGLEAAGFTDGTAHEYGYPDVFGLAEALFDKTPRLVNRKPGALINPWFEQRSHHLLRGLVFAAPGLLFISSLPGLTSPTDRWILISSLLVGWSGSQVLAYVFTVLAGRQRIRAGQGALFVGFLVIAAAGLVLAGIGLGLGAAPAVAALSAGQVVYLAASAVVISSRRLRLVLVALSPGLLTALAALLGAPRSVSAAGAVMSVGLAVCATFWISRSVHRQDVDLARTSLSAGDWVAAGWQAAYGVCAGLLVSLPSVSQPVRMASTSLLPMIWSIGLAEWQIVRFRRRAFELLGSCSQVGAFKHRALSLALTSLGGYLLGLTLLSGIAASVAVIDGSWGSAVSSGLTAGWLLGQAFYQALVISAMGHTQTVVIRTAVCAESGFLLLANGLDQLAFVVPSAALALWLLPPFVRTVRDPTRHL